MARVHAGEICLEYPSGGYKARRIETPPRNNYSRGKRETYPSTGILEHFDRPNIVIGEVGIYSRELRKSKASIFQRKLSSRRLPKIFSL